MHFHAYTLGSVLALVLTNLNLKKAQDHSPKLSTPSQFVGGGKLNKMDK